jgi:hypothetical protein
LTERSSNLSDPTYIGIALVSKQEVLILMATIVLMTVWSILTVFAVMGISFLFYMIPSIAAIARNKQDVGTIVILNVFLGWTFVGWVVALVWALRQDATAMRATSDTNTIPAQTSQPHV